MPRTHRAALALVTAALSIGVLAGSPTAAGVKSACGDPYNPAITPADFTNAHGKPNPIDNPYNPLRPGTTYVYDGTKDGEAQHDVVAVTKSTKSIIGVTTSQSALLMICAGLETAEKSRKRSSCLRIPCRFSSVDCFVRSWRSVVLPDGSPIIALCSGRTRVDEALLAKAVGVVSVSRATADLAKGATGYAIGGVPPFGHLSPLPTFVDRDLLRYGTVWAAAGTPRHVFAIAPAELVRVTEGTVADLAVQK